MDVRQEKNTGGFIYHKTLADLYNVTRQTMSEELNRIEELHRKTYQRKYSPAEVKIIFKHLGTPGDTNN